MGKLKFDLHDIFNKKQAIEETLNQAIDEAEEKKVSIVEIVPGKGSGQLKKRVLKFLERPDIKQRYHRIDKDPKNSGRIFVRFKHK